MLIIKKNFLNVFSSLYSISTYITPYIFFLIVNITAGIDNTIIIATWIMCLLINTLYFNIEIKKSDICTGHLYIYDNKKYVFKFYFVFSFLITIPFYVMISFFCSILLSLFLCTIGIFTQCIFNKISLSISQNVLFILNRNLTSSLIIVGSILISLLLEFFLNM